MSTTSNVFLSCDINQYEEQELHILRKFRLYLLREPDSEATFVEGALKKEVYHL